MHKFLRPSLLATLAAALAASLSVPGDARTDPSAITGLWLSSKEKVVIEFYPCEGEYCAKIAWLDKPYKRGKLRRDDENPDPALRDRPWCGIEVIRGLEVTGDDAWENGKFYYPKKGQTYDVDIKQKSEEAIEIRIYLGIPLIGKSEVWTRPEPGQEIGCVPDEAAQG